MIVRIYTQYGEAKPVLDETLVLAVSDIGVELMQLFLMNERIPLEIAFKKGDKNTECCILIKKPERRELTL